MEKMFCYWKIIDVVYCLYKKYVQFCLNDCNLSKKKFILIYMIDEYF